MIEYNICTNCGANNGRAGLLWGNIRTPTVKHCENCYRTLATGTLTIHAHLRRTDEEMRCTAALLNGSAEVKK